MNFHDSLSILNLPLLLLALWKNTGSSQCLFYFFQTVKELRAFSPQCWPLCSYLCYYISMYTFLQSPTRLSCCTMVVPVSNATCALPKAYQTTLPTASGCGSPDFPCLAICGAGSVVSPCPFSRLLPPPREVSLLQLYLGFSLIHLLFLHWVRLCSG